MKFFWKLYYRFKFGDQYETRINNAIRMGWIVDDSTSGDISHFHNMKGERIRGWHKKSHFPSDKHPLEVYYIKK